MTGIDDDEWYTEEDTNTENSWNRMEENFTNAGYREGITAGKEAALQEGFDDGFASIGVPLGQQLGSLRGIVHALLTTVQSSKRIQAQNSCMTLEPALVTELQTLASRLAQIRMIDLAPRDIQAEQHAREHRDIEAEGRDDTLADAFMSLSSNTRPPGSAEVAGITKQLEKILASLQLKLDC